jgi:hypothetical protein
MLLKCCSCCLSVGPPLHLRSLGKHQLWFVQEHVAPAQASLWPSLFTSYLVPQDSAHVHSLCNPNAGSHSGGCSRRWGAAALLPVC